MKDSRHYNFQCLLRLCGFCHCNARADLAPRLSWSTLAMRKLKPWLRSVSVVMSDFWDPTCSSIVSNCLTILYYSPMCSTECSMGPIKQNEKANQAKTITYDSGENKWDQKPLEQGAAVSEWASTKAMPAFCCVEASCTHRHTYKHTNTPHFSQGKSRKTILK